MQRKVIFDTETTGLSHQDGDRVIEIGAVEMVEGTLTGRTFHQYINPERDVPMEAYRIHRISTEMLQDKPLFSDPAVGPAFVEFVKGAELVAHNAAFDVGFIDAELERLGLSKLRNKITDTVPLARRKFPGSPVSLDALCSRFGISKAEREAQGHGALLDSELLARVYIELTGGAQGGLSFDRPLAGEDGAGGRGRKSKQRPKPLPSPVTDAEREAHEAFIATMGEKALWRQVS
ncbi:MAG: DNA polymerase III subunit epsilon [Parvularculaceae bacterium]|nr:DNA polymerase III subunit epsilon [Parvularculaceae bacterium]